MAVEDGEVTGASAKWGQNSKADNAKARVFFNRKDGKRFEFLPTLETVIRHWENELS